MKSALRILLTTSTIGLLLAGIAVMGPSSDAADSSLSQAELTHFVFTCETRERDFYDWIEAVLWKKPRHFGRNLDAAIDALVSEPDWTIRIADQSCKTDTIPKSRREALYFMVDDAHTEGAGKILYGR